MPLTLSLRPTASGGADNGPLVPLGRLCPGQSAVVRRIVGRAEDVHRLEEFGLCRGTPIEMFRQGNPCILRLAGGKVCLRADRSLEILVAPVPAVS
jgi:Fe2+ transport system protein FeoA